MRVMRMLWSTLRFDHRLLSLELFGFKSRTIFETVY